MKKSFKRLALVASLAFAGLLSTTSFFVGSKTINDFDAKEAVSVADNVAIYETKNGVNYRVIYYFVSTSWEKGNYFNYYSDSNGHCFNYSTDGSSYTLNWFGSGTAGDASFSEIIGDFAAKIYLPSNTTKIRFQSSKYLDGGGYDKQRETDVITLSSANQAFVITTNKWNDWPWGDAGYQTATPKTYSEYMAYFRTYYFMVTSSWHGGDSSLGYKGSDPNDYNYVRNYSIDRSTPILSNTLHNYVDGGHYATFLIPDSTRFWMENGYKKHSSTNLPAAGAEKTSSSSNNHYKYVITSTHGASKQDTTFTNMVFGITYPDFPADASHSTEITKYTYGTGVSLSSDTPTRDHYTFDGYYYESDHSGTAVTSISSSDYGEKALYSDWIIDKFTVTWKNYDGTTLETDAEVPYGSTPTYDGSTPTKTATSYSSFEFDGWSPEISSVSDDIIYTAQFEEIYNISFTGGEYFYVVDKLNCLGSSAHLRIFVKDDDDVCVTSPVFTRVIYSQEDGGNYYNTYRVVLPSYTGTSSSGWTKFILLRCDPSKDSATTKDTAGVYNESYESLLSYWGGYNKWWIDSWVGDNVHFNLGKNNDSGSNGFLSGQTYYFERWASDFGTDKNNWAVYFFNPVDNDPTGGSWTTNGDAWTTNFCKLIEGHSAGDYTNGLFEFEVPKTNNGYDVVWHKVILVRMNSSTISWDNKQVQGPDCILTTRNNVIKSSASAYEQNYSVTDVDRMHFFANYFNKQTDGEQGGVCVYDGSTTKENLTSAWSKVYSQYPLKESVKYQFKIATADQYGSAKTQAAARYDYILYRHGDEFELNDFASRKTGGHYSYGLGSFNNPFQLLKNDETVISTMLIIVSSSVSLLSITALSVLVIRKRKTKE